MSKKYYESNRDKIIERNKASYQRYYTEHKKEILEKKRIQYKEKIEPNHHIWIYYQNQFLIKSIMINTV